MKCTIWFEGTQQSVTPNSPVVKDIVGYLFMVCNMCKCDSADVDIDIKSNSLIEFNTELPLEVSISWKEGNNCSINLFYDPKIEFWKTYGKELMFFIHALNEKYAPGMYHLLQGIFSPPSDQYKRIAMIEYKEIFNFHDIGLLLKFYNIFEEICERIKKPSFKISFYLGKTEINASEEDKVTYSSVAFQLIEIDKGCFEDEDSKIINEIQFAISSYKELEQVHLGKEISIARVPIK